jgi:hypothetical protein
MHRKQRESLTIRLNQQPEYFKAGSGINPLRFFDLAAMSFVTSRYSKSLSGFFF